MNRRNFIHLLGGGLFVPLVEPQIKYILPPLGGWKVITPIPGGFSTLIQDEKGALKYTSLDIYSLKQEYLDMRAANGLYPPQR